MNTNTDSNYLARLNAVKNIELSATQAAALDKLPAGRYSSAADLGVATSTLQSLVRLGLAQVQSFPTVRRNEYSCAYRISMAGITKWNMQRRDAK